MTIILFLKFIIYFIGFLEAKLLSQRENWTLRSIGGFMVTVLAWSVVDRGSFPSYKIL
jgi:hypothetical protein